MNKKDAPSRSSKASPSALHGTLQGSPPRRQWSLAGQAYTEYLLILLFGVFLGLGIAVIAPELPEQFRIVNRLYGYVFDYYASLANYLSLPLF
jgi:hypothetical protein